MPKKALKDYETLPYRIDLYFDRDDHVWVARYPELPGCIAHGATKEEAIAKGDEAKSLWLETALENGDTPPEPQEEPTYSGKFVLRLPKTLHERAAKAAEREGVSLNHYLLAMIASGLGANDLFTRLVKRLQRPWLQFLGTPAMFTAVDETSDVTVHNMGNHPFITFEAKSPTPSPWSPMGGEKQDRPEVGRG